MLAAKITPLTVYKITDEEKIKGILFHPDIVDRVTEDGAASKEDFVLPDNCMYIMDENFTCLMIYHWLNVITLECHVHVHPNYRHNAMEFGQAALQWAWNNTRAMKINAQIPEMYPDVIRFALKNGFKKEGLNEGSYLKNGNIHSMVYLGIKRP